ncbi:GspK family T2SS minor pseudopilin variant XcpX [Maricurvus nonylphenolicus]|uniref:type II secretion system minor pseudopilin GspK n=1 Tax=Maricurvus nonylphenolicus TaxID=1008307 RepID=UPI0036F3A9AF
MSNIKHQSGVVLIIALLIAALVASIAVAFAENFQLQGARSENRWHGGQAQAYLLGAESLARVLLEDDIQSNATDHLNEDWAKKVAPFAIEGGWLSARIEDAQGRFNLNALAGKVDSPNIEDLSAHDPVRFTVAQKRFIRLLQTFEAVPLSLDEAISVTEAVIDWLDQDNDTTGFSGAESDYYASLDTPYRIANRRFVDVSELRLVRHMSAALYQALLPYVVVLPGTQGLNINTASLKLLRTLQSANELEPLSTYDAEQLILAREGSYYRSVKAFLNSEEGRQLAESTGNLQTEGLTVASGYFVLYAEVSLVRQRRQLTSVLVRNGESVTPVLRRNYW